MASTASVDDSRSRQHGVAETWLRMRLDGQVQGGGIVWRRGSVDG